MSNHEHLPPRGYVQACEVFTHGDQIADGVATMTLDAACFPSIVRALNLIREDNGGPSWPPEDAPLIAARWQPYLVEIEAAIASLADDAIAPGDDDARRSVAEQGFCYVDSELYTFCNGEATVMEAIAARSPALTLASKLLNDFFEGWSLFDDVGFDPMIGSDKNA